MERLLWFVRNAPAIDVILPVLKPLLVGMALYQLDYLWLAIRCIWTRVLGRPGFQGFANGSAPSACVVLPTLLRSEADYRGLLDAASSVITNGYPGRLTVVLAIDDRTERPDLFADLCAWCARVACPDDVRIAAVGGRRREGKAMAIERGLDLLREWERRDASSALPTVFFNMDADSELGPRALERMAFKLTQPAWFGDRPMIVASNVSVRATHYWGGWRRFFSVEGQVAISVAREYMTSISLGKHNTRVLPVTSVSGALYATWFELHDLAPRFARFLTTIRVRDLVAWWLGGAPPSFAGRTWRPLPEAMIGPGDDTYVTWVASMATWRDGRLSLDFPRTPAGALLALARYWVCRPIAYDPLAKVYTSSPTSVRGLFRQRVRWNGSRLFNTRRLGPAMAFHWGIALAVLADLTIVAMLNVALLGAVVLAPFVPGTRNWLALSLMVSAATLTFRALGTALAIFIDGDHQQWRKLLAVPASLPYHFVFNILTTLVAWVEDLLLFGAKTNFAPEQTLIDSQTTRPALLYRARRAFLLAIRSVTVGDVPFGWWWFGWRESPFTPNGYEGWISGRVPPQVFSPEPALGELTRETARRTRTVRARVG
ncbi:MAG: hypothetical protein H6726_25780 [Sandaracinaceae bacterium]|nr:hypothetical protein [Sandaracinaceae bacterium]